MYLFHYLISYSSYFYLSLSLLIYHLLSHLLPYILSVHLSHHYSPVLYYYCYSISPPPSRNTPTHIPLSPPSFSITCSPTSLQYPLSSPTSLPPLSPYRHNTRAVATYLTRPDVRVTLLKQHEHVAGIQ